MSSIVIAAALLSAQTVPSTPQPLARANAPVGQETVISFAANGGLRDWRRAPDKDALFVRDRTERWYRVALSGPCGLDRQSFDALSYTTDTVGTFDRFSRLNFSSTPFQVCRVRSIVRLDAPPQGPRSARRR